MMKPTQGCFANRCGYTDVHPFEVVRIVSDKCIEVRAMDTSDNKTKLDFHVGGFSAHCSNQKDQSYDFTSNPDNQTIKVRLHKDTWWRSKHGERFYIAEAPRKFHDYNF